VTPGSLPNRVVVVVGGGVAGLAAVSRLSEHDVLLLEESDRLGGRMASLTEPDGSFVNLGAHLLTGGRSSIAELAATSGLTTIPVPGIKSALWFDGALYMHRRAELYPFMLPLSMRERWALVRTGARIRLLAEAWRRARRPRSGESAALYRRRLARFRSERTFAELLDGLPPRVAAVFATAARRSSGEADELTVGAAVSIFGALWVGATSESVRNVSGGAGLLGEHWRHALGDRAVLGACVTEVHEDDDQVLVTYVVAGQEQRIAARHVIVAAPAPVAARILPAVPAEVGDQLRGVRYGPFVCMGLVTRDIGAVVWDDVYAVSTPGLAFDMLFHHTSSVRDADARAPGRKSLMCYAGGAHARPLLELSEAEVQTRFLADVEQVLPEVHGALDRVVVRHWPAGNCFPTPASDLTAVELWDARNGARVHLAGDYLAALGGTADAAAASGVAAADVVAADLVRVPAMPALDEGERRHG